MPDCASPRSPRSLPHITEVDPRTGQATDVMFPWWDTGLPLPMTTLFKGACGRGIYDNMKTAVETVFVGRDRLYNRRFLPRSSSKIRISVSCSRAGLAALLSNSSLRSEVHRPSFGRGWIVRSYSNDVSPDRKTLRIVFREIPRSLAISLIVLPLTKCSRRIRAIVSTTSIP
jgi:hypothetical protein